MTTPEITQNKFVSGENIVHCGAHSRDAKKYPTKGNAQNPICMEYKSNLCVITTYCDSNQFKLIRTFFWGGDSFFFEH